MTSGSRAIRIVLTGGPGAGKTRAASALYERYGPSRVVLLPEAATQVYQRLGRRWTELTVQQRRETQRAMYELQLSQEAEAAGRASAGQLVLLDRGTLDGAGYWPDGVAAFFEAMGTTESAELARYDGVVHLETASALGLYDHDASNAVRFESAAEAMASDRTMLSLWSKHPRLERVRAEASWEAKLEAVDAAVRRVADLAGYHWQ